MKKNEFKSSYKLEDAPKSLSETMFYGLELDDEQKAFRDAIYDPKKLLIACNAKAGTGKTTISVAVAHLLVQYGFYNGIIYVVSPTMEQRQGYLPGTQESKSAPYRQPLDDALYTIGEDPLQCIISEDNLQAMKNGRAYIEFVADTYLRGINFEHKVIIVDEAQNFHFDSLKKVLTRAHDTCKVIVIGHSEQCDLFKHPERSGFVPYLNAINKIKDTEERVAVCELHTNHRGWISTFCDNVQME